MRRLLCPYCFESYPPSALGFRCVTPDPTRCPMEEDQHLARYERMQKGRLLAHVFLPPRRLLGTVTAATCRCGAKTTKRVCPFCHNELPRELGLSRSCSIALVGAKEVGKSHYIAVLIHQLRNRIGDRFQAAFSALDEQTRRRYSQDFESYVFQRRIVIPGTLSARAQIGVKYPLIYRFLLEQRGLFVQRPLSTNLVFFDTAGEDLGHVDTMSTETRYVAQSQGIIFLLDPLQIPSIRDRMPASVPLPAGTVNPVEIVERVVDLIRGFRGLKPTQKIDTPVALAFSKIDAVRSLIDQNSPIHRVANHDGYFDQSDAEEMNESMRAHVHSWVGPAFDAAIRHNFKHFMYFGLSALGAGPDSDGRLQAGATPFRVEDPLLWVLHRHGIIPARRTRR
ncbi:MAG: hypothetical protein U1A78_02890 [Polyangia bacterium]